MNILLRLLLRPQIMVFLVVLAMATVFGTRGSNSGTSSGGSSNNPWSKNYDSAAADKAVAARSSRTREITIRVPSSGSRLSNPGEVEELRRDETYRRQVLREMRQAHEAEYGSVDNGY